MRLENSALIAEGGANFKRKLDPCALSGRGRFAVLIPVYNHARTVAGVVEKAQRLDLPVVVVDDGSTDSTADELARCRGIKLLRHAVNRGKGAALMTGFAEAAKIAEWAVTLDADGQHEPADARTLMAAIPEHQRPIVTGMRSGMADKTIPWTSRFGRRFSNFWVVVSGGPRLQDTQSGFRIYPLPEVLYLEVKARRYQFEVEVLVRAKWAKIPIIEAPVGVNYGGFGERISHFRPFMDFMRNSGTFARLICRRLFSRLCPGRRG